MLLLNEFPYISKMTISKTHKIDLYLLEFSVPGLFQYEENNEMRFQNVPGSENVSDVKSAL